MMDWHGTVLGIGLGMILSSAVVAAGQFVAVPDPVLGRAVIIHESGRIQQVVSGLGFVTHVVSDGTGVAWMADSAAGRVFRLDWVTHRVIHRGFSQFVIDIAMAKDRGVICVTRWGGASEGTLLRLTPDGEILWRVEIAPAVTGVTIDHSGRIYTIHGLGFSQGLLAAYSSSGTLLFESTTGIGPTALAASSRDDVYVVCGGSDQLVVHHGKSVFSTMALPSGVAGIALDHRGGFALSRPGEDRVLFSSVSGTYAVPVVGGPNGIAFGGDGRVILSCSVSGAVQWMWPQGGAGEFAYGSPGLVSHGDMTGYHWAATAGCGSDSDGDGFTNAEEIAAGSHPFDVLSAPMSIAVVSGPSGLCHIESMGTPGAVFFLGFSHGRKSRGAGYLGLSLAADAVALASLHSSVFQASPLSAFNAIGMQNVILNLAALLAVAPVWASFVALPEFPNPTGWIASPAMKLQLQ